MFKSNCAKISVGLTLALTASQSSFGQSGPFNQPIIVPSSSSSFNQNGFNLPSQPFVSGQDIIRSTSGVSCQSAVGSSGPKLDMGLISSNDLYDRDSVSVYGRISVPLGKRPKRVDCTKLYDLEISRLKMELQLMRAGMHPDLMRMATNQPTDVATQFEKTEDEPNLQSRLILLPKETEASENILSDENKQEAVEDDVDNEALKISDMNETALK